jgi:glutamyl-tRNA reductase
MYVYSDSESKGCVFNLMEDVLLGEAGAQDEEDIGNYLLFYYILFPFQLLLKLNNKENK